MKDYRIEITVRNNRIIEHMRQPGYQSVASFCKDSGLRAQKVGEYINFKTTAVDANGRWKNTAKSLADALCCHPDQLWTNAQRKAAIKRNGAVVEMAEQEILGVVGVKSPLILMMQKEASSKLNQILSKIGGRKEDIIRMRFGLMPYHKEHVLQDVADKYDISRDRVRQIEARVLRELGRDKDVVEIGRV